jgi:hypothetical protein
MKVSPARKFAAARQNARSARLVRFSPGCGLVGIDLQNRAANEDELAQGIGSVVTF